MPTQAFKVQRGTVVLASGSATGTITAGVDYTAPAALANAFIRINSTRFTGMGRTAGGGSQNSDDTSARINNPGNLLTSIDFVRAGTANNCRVTWEIVEYVGAPGGANEFIVRDQATINASSGTSMTGSTVTSIVDINKACLWLTSQSSADTARTDWHEYLWTGALVANASDYDPTFSKLAAALNSTSHVSYAVIEFTGSNWRDVQRIETLTEGAVWTSAEDAGAGFTIAIPTTLLDVSKAFVHCQYATSNDTTGLDDAGDTITIDSTTNLRLWNRTANGTRRKVVWLIENTQADATARNMVVQHDTHFENNGGTEERVSTRTITAVDALDETSVMGTVSCDGAGTAYPRGCVDLTLTNTTTVEKRTSDNGQELQFAIEVIEWPEDPDAGGDTLQGAGTATLSVTSSGAATRSRDGSGALTVALTSSGAATRGRDGAGSANVALTTLGAGTRSTAGAGAAGAAITAVADGLPSKEGTGAATLNLASSADGSRARAGAGSTAVSISGSSQGLRVASGDASATLEISGASAASRSTSGAGTSSVTLACTADGFTGVEGAGAALVAITGAADATRSTEGAGASSASVTALGAAERTTVGAGTASLALNASAESTRTIQGGAQAEIALTAVAAGTPDSGGEGTASLAITAAAAGSIERSGEGVGAILVTSTALGYRQRSGAGLGGLALSTTASGGVTREASGSVSVVWATSAGGTVSVGNNGAGVAAVSIAGTATATKQTTGSGQAIIAIWTFINENPQPARSDSPVPARAYHAGGLGVRGGPRGRRRRVGWRGGTR